MRMLVRDLKSVKVDEDRLEELEAILRIDAAAEAVGVAINRIIELEETILWLREAGRLPHFPEDGEGYPDT